MPSLVVVEPKAPLAKCNGCPLMDQPVVQGWGPAMANRVLVGEAPSRQEVVEGKPYVGPAGVRLNEELTEAGVDRGALYLTNAVLCRFPEGGLSKRERNEAVAACHDRLITEIRLRMPLKVLALGGTAAWAVTHDGRAIKDLRKEHPAPSPYLDAHTEVRVTYHPSSLSRDAKWLERFRKDIAWLRG